MKLIVTLLGVSALSFASLSHADSVNIDIVNSASVLSDDRLALTYKTAYGDLVVTKNLNIINYSYDETTGRGPKLSETDTPREPVYTDNAPNIYVSKSEFVGTGAMLNDTIEELTIRLNWISKDSDKIIEISHLEFDKWGEDVDKSTNRAFYNDHAIVTSTNYQLTREFKYTGQNVNPTEKGTFDLTNNGQESGLIGDQFIFSGITSRLDEPTCNDNGFIDYLCFTSSDSNYKLSKISFNIIEKPAEVPVPAALWLFSSALISLRVIKK